MRIIGGIFKGNPIKVPDTVTTRPTSDRCREGIFNMLKSRGVFDKEDPGVLDLYAGSGALGFEAISNGATSLCLVENNKQANKTIEQNIKNLGIISKININSKDVIKFLESETKKYDLIFIDPPYSLVWEEVDIVMKTIYEKKLLEEDGWIILERSSRSIKQFHEDQYDFFTLDTQKIYGDTWVGLFNN